MSNFIWCKQFVVGRGNSHCAPALKIGRDMSPLSSPGSPPAYVYPILPSPGIYARGHSLKSTSSNINQSAPFRTCHYECPLCLDQVILALLCPLAIFGVVSFKSKEELQLMPQTLEEHMHDLADSDSEDDGGGEEGPKSGSQNSFHHLQEDEEDGTAVRHRFRRTSGRRPKSDGTVSRQLG